MAQDVLGTTTSFRSKASRKASAIRRRPRLMTFSRLDSVRTTRSRERKAVTTHLKKKRKMILMSRTTLATLAKVSPMQLEVL